MIRDADQTEENSTFRSGNIRASIYRETWRSSTLKYIYIISGITLMVKDKKKKMHFELRLL